MRFTKEKLTVFRKGLYESNIDLTILQDFYETYLIPYCYVIHLNDKDRLKLVFTQKEFCHLIGLETIFQTKKPDYHGPTGYENIKNGKIKMKSLIKAPGWKDPTRQKLMHFHLLYQMLESNPTLIEFDSSLLPKSKLKCDYILYAQIEKTIVHLGLKITKTGVCFPKSFLIQKVTAQNRGDKYIKGQKVVSYSHIEKTDRRSNKPQGTPV